VWTKLAQSEGQPLAPMAVWRVHPAEIGVAVVGVLLSGLWAVPSLRGMTLPLVGAQGALSVSRALLDKDQGVRVRACEVLFDVGGGGSNSHVMTMLEEHPQEAQACLRGADAKRPGSVTLTATRSMSMWAGRMVGEKDETKAGEACGLIDPIETVSKLAGMSPGIVLTQCAAAAQLDEVRLCCAQRVGALGTLASQLGAPGEVNEELAALIYGPLVRYMFGTGKGQDAKLVAVSKAVGGDMAENRAWAVRQGCKMMEGQGEVVMSSLQGLVVFVEAASTCRPASQEIRLSLGEPRVWGFVCEQLDQKRLDKDAEKEVCASIKRAYVSMAVDAARKRRSLAEAWLIDEEWASKISSSSRVKGYGVSSREFFTDEQRELSERAGFGDPSGRNQNHKTTWGQATQDGYTDREVALQVARELGVGRQVGKYLDTKDGKKLLDEKGTRGSVGSQEPADAVMARTVKLAKQQDPKGLYSEKEAERLAADKKTQRLVEKPANLKRRGR
jgi:hypothetical protein